MKRSPEDQLRIEARNNSIKQDFLSGMNKRAIAKKYGLVPCTITNICRGLRKQVIEPEEPILTEAEQKIKERLKMAEDLNRKDFTLTQLVGALEPLITVAPKRRLTRL